MQSAIEYAAIPTINLTPLFLVTNPLTNSSQSDTLQVKPLHARTRANFCANFVPLAYKIRPYCGISPNMLSLLSY